MSPQGEGSHTRPGRQGPHMSCTIWGPVQVSPGDRGWGVPGLSGAALPSLTRGRRTYCSQTTARYTRVIT